jgi:hypothetical protein
VRHPDPIEVVACVVLLTVVAVVVWLVWNR